MTGKTHLSIALAASSAALLVAGAGIDWAGVSLPEGVALVVGQATVSSGNPLTALFPPPSAASTLLALVLLVFLGVVAGLFPDLDAPEAEIYYLPGSIGRSAVRVVSLRSRGLRLILDIIVWIVTFPVVAVLRVISFVIRRFTGHRGFTHTLLGAATFTVPVVLIVWLLTGNVLITEYVAGVWALGYLSHLAADACTISGVPFWWAIPLLGASRMWVRGRGLRTVGSDNFYLLPRSIRVRTGTWPDVLVIRWLAILVAIGCLALIAVR